MKRDLSNFALGIEIYETARTMRRHFDRQVRALGFTQGQWRVLLILDRRPGSSQAALADLLDMQPISVTRILDRMVASGLIERRPDPNDRRAVQLFLMDEAGPIIEVLYKVADEIHTQSKKGLTAEDQERVLALLRHMKSNIESAESDAPVAPAKRISNI